MAEWSTAQLKYQTWLSVPARLRPKHLKSRKQVAQRLGVDADTLCRWEAEPGWWDAVFATARSVVGREVADILDSMAREAKEGSVMAAKLCLEVLGVHADKLQHSIELENDQLVVTIKTAPEPPQIPDYVPEELKRQIEEKAAQDQASAAKKVAEEAAAQAVTQVVKDAAVSSAIISRSKRE